MLTNEDGQTPPNPQHDHHNAEAGEEQSQARINRLGNPKQEEGDCHDGQHGDVRIRFPAPNLVVVRSRVLLGEQLKSFGI